MYSFRKEEKNLNVSSSDSSSEEMYKSKAKEYEIHKKKYIGLNVKVKKCETEKGLRKEAKSLGLCEKVVL